MIGISFIYPHYLWLLLLIPLTVGLALFGRRALSRLRLWGGLALRILLLLLIIFSLAGVQLRLPSHTLTAVFVLDVSDSIPAAEQSRGEELVRQAIQAIPRGDRSAVVVFGEDALVERLASEDSSLSRLSSVPVTTRTDIASALQLAMALFPDEGAKRLVLLSDGRENLSYALKQAELAAYQDIELQYIPLGEDQKQVEVLVDALEAPAETREGQSIDLGINIESTAPVSATLRVFADGELVTTREVNLQTGANHYSVPIANLAQGFHRFRAQVLPDADNRLQNNEASAFTNVSGPSNVLIVEGSPGEADNLAPALEAAKMKVTRIAPSALPATLPEMAQYDAIVLANVPAYSLPSGAMDALPVYVRDLGKGLLMVGGDNTFGAGGYLRTPIETAMPVTMDVKSRELASNLALIVAVDKSGSMGRCHCDNPDLNQTYTAVETGQPKVDIAKEAIMRSAAALGDQDYLGVVTFDSQAHWALNVEPLPNPNALEQAIGTFQAAGQTNMQAGVTAAYDALKGVNAKRKHIILMTDGWVRTGDLTAQVEKMRDEGITLSIIAAGGGSAEYLKLLAQNGGGTYYPAVDMMSVPEIFLKETVKSVGQYIIEEPFYPLPNADAPGKVMRGIDINSLPGLLGYNGTSPKGTAHLDLLTPRGDPLLASWQYGLGRSAVWTSDLKGRWGTDWVKWADFPRFAAQLVSSLIQPVKAEGLEASVSQNDQGAAIQAAITDDGNRPLNNVNVEATLIDPELKSSKIKLDQVGPGKYQATSRVDQPGTYLINLSAEGKGSTMLGLVVPYSPEYRAGGINRGLLEELARVTGGGPLAEPVQAFLHNLPSVGSAREIWRALLLIAALLFPLDVALRRLIISKRDLQTARAWVGDRLHGRTTSSAQREAPLLGQLFAARDRAREREAQRQNPSGQAAPPTLAPHAPGKPPAEKSPAPSSAAPAPQAPPAEKPAAPTTSEDAMARLREAKKRARR